MKCVRRAWGPVALAGVVKTLSGWTEWAGSIGSGDIDVSEIGGNFSVRAKGSGDVHQRGVRGRSSMSDYDE